MNGSSPALTTDALPPRRARSYTAARRHSAVVRSLKIAIPFGAIVAVVGVLFVTFFNPFGRLPGLTVGPVSITGTKIAMEGPRLTGFRSKDKRPYEVTATTAFQDIRAPNVIELKEMRGRMAVDDSGGFAHLTSSTGVFDTGKDHLDLSQNIRIWTDKGEEILLRSASIDMKQGAGFSREPVRIRTPTLTLEADTMDMQDSGRKMVFVGRVKTVLMRGLETAPKGRSPDDRAQGATAPGTTTAPAATIAPAATTVPAATTMPAGTTAKAADRPAKVTQAEAGGTR